MAAHGRVRTPLAYPTRSRPTPLAQREWSGTTPLVIPSGVVEWGGRYPVGGPRPHWGRRAPSGGSKAPHWGVKPPHWGHQNTPVGEKNTPVGWFSTPVGSHSLPSGVARLPHWGGSPPHWETPLGRCPPHWETPLGCSRPQRGRDHPDGKLRLGWHHPTRRDEWGGRYPNGHGRARPSYARDLPTFRRFTTKSRTFHRPRASIRPSLISQHRSQDTQCSPSFPRPRRCASPRR